MAGGGRLNPKGRNACGAPAERALLSREECAEGAGEESLNCRFQATAVRHRSNKQKQGMGSG